MAAQSAASHEGLSSVRKFKYSVNFMVLQRLSVGSGKRFFVEEFYNSFYKVRIYLYHTRF
jgi:hypothetical protein